MKLKLNYPKKIKDLIAYPNENLYNNFVEKFESLKIYDENCSDSNLNKFNLIQYLSEKNHSNFKFGHLYAYFLVFKIIRTNWIFISKSR